MARPAFFAPLLDCAVVCSLALGLAAARPAMATVNLLVSWDHPAHSPAEIVSSKAYGGPGSYDVYVTLTGEAQPFTAFQFWFQVMAGIPRVLNSGVLPPAWRFDGTSCEAGHACFDPSSFFLADTALAGRSLLTSVTFDRLTGWETIYHAEAHLDSPVHLDSTQAYTMIHYRFELTGACGGETDPAYLAVNQTENYDSAFIVFVWPASNILGWNTPAPLATTASVNRAPAPLLAGGPNAAPPYSLDPNLVPCDLQSPTLPTTWGQIKATYR
jgi:hypothetical protein